MGVEFHKNCAKWVEFFISMATCYYVRRLVYHVKKKCKKYSAHSWHIRQRRQKSKRYYINQVSIYSALRLFSTELPFEDDRRKMTATRHGVWVEISSTVVGLRVRCHTKQRYCVVTLQTLHSPFESSSQGLLGAVRLCCLHKMLLL